MKKVHSTLVAVSLVLAMALTLSCTSGGGGSHDDPSSSSGNNLLLYFTSDYQNEGVLRWMNTNATSLLNNPQTDSLEGFNQDSKVFAHDGKIFLLERPLDNATFTNGGVLNCLYPPTSSSSSKPTPYNSPQTLAAGSNPYDIAFDNNGKGYIAQYGLNYIQVFNVNSCALTDTITLPNVINSPIFGSASSQNAVSIKTDGTKLFVVMQRWKSYPDTAANGILVRLNTNGTPTNPPDTVQLKYYNPQASVLNKGKIYIASAYSLNDKPTGPGIFPDSSGIEYVTLTGTSSAPLVDGNTLGGGATDMVLDTVNQILYTTVYISWGNAPVKKVPISGTPITNVYGITQAVCLAYDKDIQRLFVGDGNPFSGPIPNLKFYNPNPSPGTTSNVGNSEYLTDDALAPYSLAIVRY